MQEVPSRGEGRGRSGKRREKRETGDNLPGNVRMRREQQQKHPQFISTLTEEKECDPFPPAPPTPSRRDF